MKLTFIGADHEVTGSCHYLNAAGKDILVDFGMPLSGMWRNEASGGLWHGTGRERV